MELQGHFASRAGRTLTVRLCVKDAKGRPDGSYLVNPLGDGDGGVKNWMFTKEDTGEGYTLSLAPGRDAPSLTCDCAGFVYAGRCKHVSALLTVALATAPALGNLFNPRTPWPSSPDHSSAPSAP